MGEAVLFQLDEAQPETIIFMIQNRCVRKGATKQHQPH